MDIARLRRLIDQVVAERSAIELTEDGHTIQIDATATIVEVPQESSMPVVAVADPDAVVAPCFGIIHLTPAPGADPFVKAGGTVVSGQKLCLIEAMKVFNAVTSSKVGKIKDILVAPGEEVVRGQALFRLESETG